MLSRRELVGASWPKTRIPEDLLPRRSKFGWSLDQTALPWFVELNRGLRDRLDETGFRTRMSENVERLQRLGAELAELALQDDPALAVHVPTGLTRIAGDFQYIAPSMAMTCPEM